MISARLSATYIIGSNLIAKAFSFIGSIVLARLLFPEDYGYILIANIFTGFIDIIGNTGFENFYLQEKFNNKNDEHKVLNITTSLRLGLNTLLFAIQFGISYIVEFNFNEPIIGQLLRIFSFNFLITGISITPLYILRKQLNFKPESIANLSREGVGVITKVVFASIGFGALSFAFGSVIGNIIRGIILLKNGLFIPQKGDWDKTIFKKIIYFGKHNLLGGIGYYIVDQADKIMISKGFSKAEIGYYNFGYSQANVAYGYFINPISALIVSFCAKYKENKQFLFDILSQLSFLLAVIFVPLFIFAIINAEGIIEVVFGEKWLPASLLFQLFLGFYLSELIAFPTLGILTAFGFPEIASRIVISRGITMVISLYLLTLFNPPIYFYAMGFIIISTLFTWIKAYYCLQKINHSIFQYIRTQSYNIVNIITITIMLLVIHFTISDSIYLNFTVSALFLITGFTYFTLYRNRNQFLSALKIALGENKWYYRIESLLPNNQ